jgi:hypothetical protein
MNMSSGSGRFLAITAAAAMLSAAAFAGHKSSQNVVISTGSRFANGDAGHVHNSSDTVQYIMCRSFGTSGACFARNKDNVVRSCSTTSSSMLNGIRSITSESYIYFQWDEDGVCTSITVENGSVARPKQP